MHINGLLWKAEIEMGKNGKYIDNFLKKIPESQVNFIHIPTNIEHKTSLIK